METLSYIIQANLYLVVFFAFYLTVLRHETFNQLNRFYLVLSAIFALLVPFLQSDWVKSWFITQQVNEVIYSYYSPEIIIFATQNSDLTYYQLITYIYLLGISIFSVKFIYRLIKTSAAFKNSALKVNNAFSFFSKIWIDKSLAQYPTIAAHEQVHYKQLHSADVVLFELIAIVFWFNPVVYLYKKAIGIIHEFIADDLASKTLSTKADYAVLLVSQQFQTSPEILLSNQFFKQSTLKLRIKMLMKKRSNNVALLKYGFIAPLFVGMMVFASASIARSEKISTLVKQTKKPITQTPDAEPIKISPAQTIMPQDTAKPASNTSTESDEIFTTVDKSPEFPGGFEALYKYIGQTIKYPEQAQKEKIQGRIFIKFIVEKDGSVSSPQVLKSLGYGCDEEAIRVITQMPKWQAGSQNGKTARVYFTMPIQFSLEKITKTENVNSANNGEKLIETPFSPSLNGFNPNKYIYIVDFKEVGIEELNKIHKEDIESVNVLKKEEAIKSFGERGKEGVIYIYTKKK